ncbi:uncharacterized protein ASCRUDRAFT_74207 [Ascoidea rubescens DSM 1968]|uniref:L domain-like protein n=1 Tax=Ascoidea rubescens DSM 1968 TaxID=1344418 RepID=A0A1D2VM83_9ASCO|nr:hypothetical protein ASCRUDRAFT_74207 [Ascoidea rubescens DSM 1968]ODV62726.1 hypothetical protein ASCRUDRAFT_74207 [Ascoidea rubescens DSM 1968]
MSLSLITIVFFSSKILILDSNNLSKLDGFNKFIYLEELISSRNNISQINDMINFKSLKTKNIIFIKKSNQISHKKYI